MAHRQAIIPPPLNIFVFCLGVLWYFCEAVLLVLSCGRFMVNIERIKPIHIDYEQELIDRQKSRQKLVRPHNDHHNDHHSDDHHKNSQFSDDFVANNLRSEMEEMDTICCGLFQRRYKDENSNKDSNKYCKFCRYYMRRNGNIKHYQDLFRKYRLDDDDVKILKNIFKERGLCPKCYRPYKLNGDGTSNRYQRWQVILEMISFYVFLCFLYWSLLICLCLPALFVGVWSRIQSLSDRSKNTKNVQNQRQSHERSAKISETNYRSLIRQIIAEETTTEFEELEHKMERIEKMVEGMTATHSSQNKGDQDGDAFHDDHDHDHHHQDQYANLVSMVNDLSHQIKLLRGTIITNISSNKKKEKKDKNKKNFHSPSPKRPLPR